MIYSIERYNAMVDKTFDELKKLAALKGAEYSGDTDRLANFRRNGLDLELPIETVWRVYAAKHWDAIGQYIKDIQNDKKRERLEGIAGRVDDLLVYLLLFKAMIEERSTVDITPLTYEESLEVYQAMADKPAYYDMPIPVNIYFSIVDNDFYYNRNSNGGWVRLGKEFKTLWMKRHDEFPRVVTVNA